MDLSSPSRRWILASWLAGLVTLAVAVDAVPADGQTVREVFQKVAPTVVVIKARGRDVTAQGQSGFARPVPAS